jgi:hypothetical protein
VLRSSALLLDRVLVRPAQTIEGTYPRTEHQQAQAPTRCQHYFSQVRRVEAVYAKAFVRIIVLAVAAVTVRGAVPDTGCVPYTGRQVVFDVGFIHCLCDFLGQYIRGEGTGASVEQH